MVLCVGKKVELDCSKGKHLKCFSVLFMLACCMDLIAFFFVIVAVVATHHGVERTKAVNKSSNSPKNVILDHDNFIIKNSVNHRRG